MNIDSRIEKYLDFVTKERLNRMVEVLENRTRYITIVTENFYDSGNVSALIRTADAFGIQDVHVVEIDNKFSISKRICRGSQNWVNIYKYSDTFNAVKNLKDKNYKVYFADPSAEYPEVDEIPLDGKTALIFGQEYEGIRDETKDLADNGFRIPIYGFVESFNVSVACAVSLSHLVSRLRKNTDKDFSLSDYEKKSILERWLVKNSLIGNLLKENKQDSEFFHNESFLIN